MEKDKLLERLLRKGTSTTRSATPAVRAAGSTTGVFQPRPITRYSPFPPSTFLRPQTPTPAGATVSIPTITTESGEFLLAENNDNLIF